MKKGRSLGLLLELDGLAAVHSPEHFPWGMKDHRLRVVPDASNSETDWSGRPPLATMEVHPEPLKALPADTGFLDSQADKSPLDFPNRVSAAGTHLG